MENRINDIYYLLITFVLLFIVMTPPLHRLLLHGHKLKPKGKGFLNFCIAKKYFFHFYIVSLFFSLFNLHSTQYLFMIHSARRLTEQILFFNSRSKMHIGHYFLGISFYIVTPISLNKAKISMMQILCFLFCQLLQCIHHYILSRSEYKRPQKLLFRYTLYPHYMAECLIYLCFLWINPNITRFLCVCWVVTYWVSSR